MPFNIEISPIFHLMIVILMSKLFTYVHILPKFITDGLDFHLFFVSRKTISWLKMTK